jgi:hypothetical protein
MLFSSHPSPLACSVLLELVVFVVFITYVFFFDDV